MYYNSPNILCAKVLRLFLGIVLLISGLAKIFDSTGTIGLMRELNVIPAEVLLVFLTALPIIEIVIGLCLIVDLFDKVITKIALVLFAGFFLISLYGAVIGLTTECGCFGTLLESKMGWRMVFRNMFFLMLVLYVLWSKKGSTNF